MRNIRSIFAVAILSIITAVACNAETTVRTLSRSITVTPVVTAGAYSAADAVGGKMEFADATSSFNTAVLSTVVVVDDADQGVALDIVCFNQSFTATADNAALAISDADAGNVVAWVSVATSDYVDLGASKVAVIGNINQLITTHGSTNLYCQMMTSGTPTYAAVDDLHVTLGFLQD